VNNFNASYIKLVENYNSLKFTRRLFYPRNFNISEEFKNSFKKEFKRLSNEGHSPKHIITKISKALMFLANK
jgi:hypothetical protein